MPTFEAQKFQLQKRGSSPGECEDAMAMAWTASTGVFAIADGVTDSAFQKLWADMLVNEFVRNPPHSFTPSWLENTMLRPLQSQWHDNIQWDKLPWHGLTKAQQTGALATFLGIHINLTQLKWKGISIGDCNLFHLRCGGKKYQLLSMQPNSNTSDFGTSPYALSSIDKNYSRTWSYAKRLQGALQLGDIILLTTDALALWIVESLDTDLDNPKGETLDPLVSLNSQEQFAQFIDTLRDARRIKNDDTSLLMIRISTGLPN